MPTPQPFSVGVALVQGGVPDRFTPAQLQWLMDRHLVLGNNGPADRRTWHMRWGYTMHDLISTILATPRAR